MPKRPRSASSGRFTSASSKVVGALPCMECPVCLDNLKRQVPSITASCQGCDKSFHLECLIESAASGTRPSPRPQSGDAVCKTCSVRVRLWVHTGKDPQQTTTYPTMATYSSYDVARQLVQIRAYVKLDVDGLAEVPTDILSALLHLTAEWRSVEEIETLIQMGANPHETHGGFTVLEMFIQGHDGYWRGKDSVEKVEVGVKMLAKYGVTCEDLSHRWILSNCEEMISNSEYLREFFKV